MPLASDSLLTTSSSRPGVVPPGLVENAVKILEKVIGNIIGTPEEEKFRKIRTVYIISILCIYCVSMHAPCSRPW